MLEEFLGSLNACHPTTNPKELVRRRDDWYAVIRRRSEELVTTLHRSPSSYPSAAATRGRASFNYSHHDGYFRLGEGDSEFLTRWSKAGNTAIHIYRDGTNLEVAVADQGQPLASITDASMLNYTSRVRTPQLGQAIILENHRTRYCGIVIKQLQDDTRGDATDWIDFDYIILEDGSDDFSVA